MGVRERYRIDDPFTSVRLRKVCLTRVERVTPSRAEVDLIVAFLENRSRSRKGRVYAKYARMMADFGLGLAEILSLTWGAVDFQNQSIDVVRKKTGVPFTVPIFKWGVALINDLFEEARIRSGGKNPGPDVTLFPKMCSVCMQSPLNRACKALGLANFTPRALRRSFIYTCRAAGVSAFVVASLQGHQDGGRLIEKVYDKARCAFDGQRKKIETARKFEQVAAAKELFGGGDGATLVVPEEDDTTKAELPQIEKASESPQEILERAVLCDKLSRWMEKEEIERLWPDKDKIVAIYRGRKNSRLAKARKARQDSKKLSFDLFLQENPTEDILSQRSALAAKKKELEAMIKGLILQQDHSSLLPSANVEANLAKLKNELREVSADLSFLKKVLDHIGWKIGKKPPEVGVPSDQVPLPLE